MDYCPTFRCRCEEFTLVCKLPCSAPPIPCDDVLLPRHSSLLFTVNILLVEVTFTTYDTPTWYANLCARALDLTRPTRYLVERRANLRILFHTQGNEHLMKPMFRHFFPSTLHT